MIDQAKLSEWWVITERMEADKAREVVLRKELFGAAFPDPVEGSKNKVSLSDGYILQGDYKVNRNVDAAIVSTLMKSGDNVTPLVTKLIDYKPSLVLKEWKALSPEDKVLVSDMVTEKPGTPTLKIVKPKR